MKRLYIFYALAVMLLASCVNTDIDSPSGVIPNQTSDGAIHIFGAVEDYDIKHVSTRAEDEISDSYISEMTMFIFKANGDIIQGYKTRNATFNSDGKLTAVNFNGCEECTTAINIQKPNPTFLIDTQDGIIASFEGESQTLVYYDNFANDLQGCKIYIVANAYHQLKNELDNIDSLSDLENFVLDIDDTLAMPMMEDGIHYRGIPMIGTPLTAKFNLRSGDKNNESVANIPLKKLYSKVRFTMQVCANQVVAGQTPKFQIEKVEVFNVPTKVRMGRKLNESGKPIYGTTTEDDYITEIAGGNITSANIGEYYQFVDGEPFVIDTFEDNEVYHNDSRDQTDDIIEFGFYMPEHKVTPNTIAYPSGMPDYCKQYYKPLGVGAQRSEDGLVTLAKIATYARIHGLYTDHNGQIKSVRYDIYLGQNEIDDFTVKRNQQLNNKLVITGLTNYYDAYGGNDENISIDHRVDVDYKGFNLSMERTAILDSHFEVRPLDIELSPGSTMRITIPTAYRTWVAMESDQSVRDHYNASKYVSNQKGKAVRKYFTTDLISELTNTNNGTITINHSGAENKTEIHRIWFYIDENPNVYDKLLGEDADKGGITSSPSDGYNVYGKNDNSAMYRICPVEFRYYGTDYDSTDGNATISKTVSLNLQQWNLWRVWSSDKKRFYDIEHEEEYLNNYASDQKYGDTQNGMPFGLEGIQLSSNVMAYWKESANGVLAGIINAIFGTDEMANSVFQKSGRAPYYDFYLTRDNFPVDKLDDNVDKTKFARNYSGLEFNKEIATTLKASSNTNAKIDGIILTEDPQSAFAYCYHKNKRNSNGEVVEQKWFLPAIDEIEDIALGAYEEFDKVFQNQEYWSCQPTYNYNDLQIKGKNYVLFGYIDLSTLKGEFYEDNTDRARSTSVYANGVNNYTTIQSGLPEGVKSGNLSITAYSGGSKDGQIDPPSYTSNNINYNADIYTIGEYRGNSPRSEINRIRAVYRSGTK